MHHSFLTHSCADGRLGCFHVLAIVNSAAVSPGVHESLFSSGFLGVYALVCFSHSESGLFTLPIVSLVVQKLLSLIRSHLFIFAFISVTLGGGS